ncbi:MAG TPA: hypothetical protein V6D22_02260, partial [Candidatus Obscuribacterales bacterium]
MFRSSTRTLKVWLFACAFVFAALVSVGMVAAGESPQSSGDGSPSDSASTALQFGSVTAGVTPRSSAETASSDRVAHDHVPAGGSPLTEASRADRRRIAASSPLTIPPIDSAPSVIETGIAGGAIPPPSVRVMPAVSLAVPLSPVPQIALPQSALSTSAARPARAMQIAQIPGGVPLQPQLVRVQMQP